MRSTLLDGVSIPRAFLVLLGMLFVQLFFVFSKEKINTRLFTSGISLALCSYLILHFISLFQVVNIAEGIWQCVKVMLFVQCFFLVFWIIERDRSSLIDFVKVMSCAALLIIVSGLNETIQLWNTLGDNKALYLINSTAEHKNLMASILFLALPFFGMLFLEKKKYWKAIAVLGILASLILIVIVQSRAVWVALIISGNFLLFATLINASRETRKGLFKMVGGIFIICLLAALVGGYMIEQQDNHQNKIRDRISAMYNFKDVKNEHTETINERLALWKNSIELFKDHPISGVGAGNWRFHFPVYGMRGLRSEQGAINFQRPHNEYLGALTELGVLGLVSFLAIFILGIYYAIHVWRKETDREKARIALLAGAGILGFMVIAFFDFPSERILHLCSLAVLLAIVAALYVQTDEKHDTIASPFLMPSILLTLCCLFVSFQRFQSERFCKNGLEARRVNNYNMVIKQLKRANTFWYSVDPMATPLTWYVGEAQYLIKKEKEALANFEASATIHPNHIHVLNNLGSTYFKLGKEKEAYASFEKALKIAPQFLNANLNLCAYYAKQNNLEKAMHHLDQAMPDSTNHRYTLFLNELTGFYLTKLQAAESNEPLNKVFESMRGNIDWLAKMHYKAKSENMSLQQRIADDALYMLKSTRQMDETQYQIFRMKYGLQ